jgi:D-arginine dehydrogenase
MASLHEVDFIVVGAGMAGASAAAHLAPRGRVAILEREEQPGYHTTGRSAALFSAIYGNAVVRALTRASRPFLFEPPAGFAPTPLVQPRATMYFAREDQLAALDRLRADADIRAATRLLAADEARAQVPAFRAGYLAAAALEEGSADIDVHALHQGFLRQARAHGARLHCGAPIAALRHARGRWRLETPAGAIEAPVVVDAAGAWGDELARAAGAAPLGLQPLRRTALTIPPPEGVDVAPWPAAIDVDEQFYFKPDAGALLLSPADETPSPPCDAQPEELDVALAVDRFEQATGRPVRRVAHRWAGLRTFAPDRTPVVGFDPRVEGFFWLVGQGGFGIQTAAALGRVAAALAAGEPMPADVAAQGVDAAMLAPARQLTRPRPASPA